MSPPLTPRPLLCRVLPDRALALGVLVGKPAAAPRRARGARPGAGSSGSVQEPSIDPWGDELPYRMGLQGPSRKTAGRKASEAMHRGGGN